MAYAVVLESKPNVGDRGYLSVWKNKIKRPMKTAVYLPQRFDNPNEFQEVSNGAHNFAKEYYAANGKDKFEHFIALNNFVVEQFVKETYPYTLTSFLAHEALYRNVPKDVIIYPSVAANSHFCNLAFHPNIVDIHLELEKVIRFNIASENKEQGMQVGLGKIGEIVENAIRWRDGSFEEVDFSQFP